MKISNKIANKLICPYTPYVGTSQRSYTCITDLCMMWQGDGEVGYCSLVSQASSLVGHVDEVEEVVDDPE